MQLLEGPIEDTFQKKKSTEYNEKVEKAQNQAGFEPANSWSRDMCSAAALQPLTKCRNVQMSKRPTF